MIGVFASFSYTGLYLIDAASGRLELLGLAFQSESGGLKGQRYNSVSSYSGDSIGGTGDIKSWWCYLGIEFEGTNLKYDCSTDGAAWSTRGQWALNIFLPARPTHICLFIDPNNASNTIKSSFKWFAESGDGGAYA